MGFYRAFWKHHECDTRRQVLTHAPTWRCMGYSNDARAGSRIDQNLRGLITHPHTESSLPAITREEALQAVRGKVFRVRGVGRGLEQLS